jgi:hypothetical protein
MASPASADRCGQGSRGGLVFPVRDRLLSAMMDEALIAVHPLSPRPVPSRRRYAVATHTPPEGLITLSSWVMTGRCRRSRNQPTFNMGRQSIWVDGERGMSTDGERGPLTLP